MVREDDVIGGRPAAAQPKQRLEYLPGRLILRIREQAVRPHLGAVRLAFTRAAARLLPEAVSAPLEYLRKNAGLRDVHALFSARRAELPRASVAVADRQRLAILSSVSDPEEEDLGGFAVVSLDPKKLTAALVKRLQTIRSVEIAEPVPARWLPAEGADPMQNLQWGLRAIRWFETSLPDSGSVRVGVLDTGVDTGHPDLRAGTIEYRHAGLKAADILGHGTHVCGIVAATTNNAVGISGVARCRLSVWKIFPDRPEAGDFYVDGERYLQALHAVIGAGVKVVNLSIGGTARSQTEALLFRRLRERGVTVVAAMGNEFAEGNPTEYPAAYPGVLAVGAVAENLRRSSFSNTGRHIGLVAPGSHILSTLPRKRSAYRDETGYAAWSGTSMATPHAAAAAALVLARFPGMTPAQVQERLRQSATRLPVMGKAAWTPVYGSGLLNLKNALS